MRETFLNSSENTGLPENKEKDKAKTKRGSGFEDEVFVTDHSADNPNTGGPGKLRELYKDVASWGVDYELGEVGLPSKLPWGRKKKNGFTRPAGRRQGTIAA